MQNLKLPCKVQPANAGLKVLRWQRTIKSKGGLKKMELTAIEIIPDRSIGSDGEVGLNLYGARYLLDKFLLIFNRKGAAKPDCLFEILQMDVNKACEFLKSNCGANAERVTQDPVLRQKIGQTLAAMQMMIHVYLDEQMAKAS